MKTIPIVLASTISTLESKGYIVSVGLDYDEAGISCVMTRGTFIEKSMEIKAIRWDKSSGEVFIR